MSDSKSSAPVICHINTREHLVTIHSSDDGPRFSVSTNDGKDVIAGGRTLDEFADQHPRAYNLYQSGIAQGADAPVLDASLTPLPISPRRWPESNANGSTRYGVGVVWETRSLRGRSGDGRRLTIRDCQWQEADYSCCRATVLSQSITHTEYPTIFSTSFR